MSEWIEVEVKLPRDGQRVIAVCGGNIFFAGYLPSMKTWRNESNEDQCVTHWMPIPELPQSKKR